MRSAQIIAILFLLASVCTTTFARRQAAPDLPAELRVLATRESSSLVARFSHSEVGRLEGSMAGLGCGAKCVTLSLTTDGTTRWSRSYSHVPWGVILPDGRCVVACFEATPCGLGATRFGETSWGAPEPRERFLTSDVLLEVVSVDGEARIVHTFARGEMPTGGALLPSARPIPMLLANSDAPSTVNLWLLGPMKLHNVRIDIDGDPHSDKVVEPELLNSGDHWVISRPAAFGQSVVFLSEGGPRGEVRLHVATPDGAPLVQIDNVQTLCTEANPDRIRWNLAATATGIAQCSYDSQLLAEIDCGNTTPRIKLMPAQPTAPKPQPEPPAPPRSP